MDRPLHYKTKQRGAIYDYIVSLNGAHVTAAQITSHFKTEGVPVSRTTVYRHLNELTESGKIRRLFTDDTSGACYQNMEDRKDCHIHFHLKCENCGQLLHLECEALNEIQEHVRDEHDFEVNALKTILYGKCNNCINKV